jgi:hypothetical protein
MPTSLKVLEKSALVRISLNWCWWKSIGTNAMILEMKELGVSLTENQFELKMFWSKARIAVVVELELPSLFSYYKPKKIKMNFCETWINIKHTCDMR